MINYWDCRVLLAMTSYFGTLLDPCPLPKDLLGQAEACRDAGFGLGQAAEDRGLLAQNSPELSA